MAIAIVSGAIANKPFNGGEAWVRLSWALGLRRLGFDVFFVEELHAAGRKQQAAEEVRELSAKVQYFARIMREFGLHQSVALIDSNGQSLWGLGGDELQEVSTGADLLINISGNLKRSQLKEFIPIKIYVDLDPGFTQFWHAQDTLGTQLEGHTHYYTVGENIGALDCPIPTNGIAWRPVRQPVVLDDWPVVTANYPWKFTTIASWRGSYGTVQVGQKSYGLKVHEFRKFIELPRRIDQACEVALDIHPAEENDLHSLRENGWRLVDPRTAAGDPAQYRHYVQQSGAEFSVAQGIYVETHSGWFSDRTIRYLASGKPVLVQDTGFSRNLPVGEGLLAFRNLDEAIAGAQSIAANYDQHACAARLIAENFFNSDHVLGTLLSQVGICADSV